MQMYELKGWNVASLGNTVQCQDSGLGVEGEGCHIKGHMQVNKVRHQEQHDDAVGVWGRGLP